MKPFKLSYRGTLLATLIGASLMLAAPVWSDHDRLRNEVRQFHSLMQSHPKVSEELRRNPKLVNSKRYLNKHDDLEKFLQRHPQVKQEIINHPSRVFGPYYRQDHPRWQHR